MIDLHTHILPNIDDGAQTIEEAVRMTDALLKQNIKTAVCTPHFDPTQISLEDFLKNRTKAMDQMGASKISLITGSETVLHDYLFHYADLSELCISHTRYLLLELPYDNIWNNKIFEILDKTIIYFDIIPIIAHIERYPAVKKNVKNIYKLKAMGCVLQLNTSSVIEKQRRKKALHYLQKGYIDVLGSDCHNMKKRPPVFTEAQDRIVQKFGIECYNKLMYQAECIIIGKDLRGKIEYMI